MPGKRRKGSGSEAAPLVAFNSAAGPFELHGREIELAVAAVSAT